MQKTRKNILLKLGSYNCCSSEMRSIFIANAYNSAYAAGKISGIVLKTALFN